MAETLSAESVSQHLTPGDPEFQQRHRSLRQKGDESENLDQALSENTEFDGNFNQEYDISKERKCKLDEILEPPIDEEEEFFHPDNPVESDSPYYIVDTEPGEHEEWETGRKGHDVRNMAVWYEHGVLPAISEETKQMAVDLLETTAEQIGDGYGVIGGSMQTFEDHLHFVAEDVALLGDEKSDFPGLNSWFMYKVEDGEVVGLFDEKVRDTSGEYLEDLVSDYFEEIAV